MGLLGAVAGTLRSRRFWVWQLAGVVIYGLPAAYRFATGSVAIPFLNFPGFWIGHVIPGNMLEKILVNAFFPGGAGGVAGEVLINSYRGEAVEGKAKYLSRLGGALLQTGVWSAFQLWGFSLMLIGPWGSGEFGNIFEHYSVFPFNFTLAAFSIFTPDIVNFLKLRLAKAYQKLGKRDSKS